MIRPTASRFRSSACQIAALASLFGSLVAREARAQELAYCDLSVPAETTDLQLNGASVSSTGVRKGQGIVVTTETANQRSTVFHKIPITFTAGGSLYQHFRVRISGGGADSPPAGADGFSFMVQNDPGGDPLGEGKTGAGLTSVGRAGEGFAYAGITQSFALELDTYQNATRQDPDGNHISVEYGGHNHHTAAGDGTGALFLGQAENATVSVFEPVSLNVLLHSLESTTASYDTRDVWIDYTCPGGSCTAKIYMTFNNTNVAANFADPTNPATLPTKPATPILTATGLSDVTQYLNGTQGYPGFSASTGASKDEHLVTYWVLSQTPFADQNTNHLEDLCDCKAEPAACGGNIPICDQSTPQGFCRGCQSNAECAATNSATPICNSVASGGTGACVQCNANTDCSSAAPNCNPTTNTCTGECTTDGECTTAQWCDDPSGGTFAGTCKPKLANGAKIPTSADHTPVLNGTCSATVGVVVCRSGVCDPANSECGFAPGDGPCGVTSQCQSGVCVATGPNAGKCEPCATGTDCGGTTPVCDPTTNQCVGCTADNQCSGATPVCNSATHACVACNGNAGSSSTEPCPNAAPYCNATTGMCTANCVNDKQCGTGDWCNNITQAGVCGPTLPNGTTVPGGTCTATLGGRACTSTVCDTSNQKCGIAEGDGTCTTSGECQAGFCVTSGTNSGKCEACAGDANCSAPTGVCNPTTSECVECTASSATACTGNTPVCNAATGACTSCTSDLGVSSAHPCATSGAPYCATGGACGHCSTSADCLGPTHAGTFCVNGSCTASCSSDADCGSADWCDGNGTCEPKLPNGSPLPGAPPIVGKCTVANGQRACLSGVCDPSDNKCGDANGTTPPNDAGTAECRSGVVGPDGKCGYPNGQGPCSTGNGAEVCRSGVCDATDNECGLGNGDGPCTATDGSTVCRSGTCDVADGKCGPTGGGTTGNDGGTTSAGDGGTTVIHDGGVACSGCVTAGDSGTSHGDGGNSCPATGCGCSTDSDCGSTTSGSVCDTSTGVCRDGCRGVGGNGCVSGDTCSSVTSDIGTCTGTSLPGAGGASSFETGGTSSFETGGASSVPPETGGAANIEGTLAGGGCACSVPSERRRAPSSTLVALGLLAASSAGRRRARRRRR